MMLLLLYFDLMMRFNSRRTLDVFFLSLFQLLIKNFLPDFQGLNLSSKFQEPLMDFPFQMHLDSLLSIIDGLNGSTNLTNLLLFNYSQQVISHQVYLFSMLPQPLHLLQATRRIINLPILTKYGCLLHHLFNILVNR